MISLGHFDLIGVPAFATLAEPARRALAAALVEENHGAGSRVVVEGEPGDGLYILVEGQATASANGVILGTYHAGDIFGEVALLTPEARRMATVTATTALRVLSLPAGQFHRLMQAHPDLQAQFKAGVHHLLTIRLLKLSSPFSGLDLGALHDLARHAEHLDVPAGGVILREGEPGDMAYCLLSGRLEVLRGEPGQRVAELEAGALFGEAALLTNAPRNATVRALTASEVLALRREALIAAMRADSRVAGACVGLLRLRERPRRVAGIEMHESVGADGNMTTILKDRRRGGYFQLSPEGRFVWDRLDGGNNLKTLSIDFFVAFKRFAPDMVANLIQALATAGFVQLSRLAPDVENSASPPRRWQRLVRGLRAGLDWQIALGNCDGWITRLYKRLGQPLFSRPARWAMTASILVGLAAFVRLGETAFAVLRDPAPMPGLWWLLPAFLFAIVAHEAGHAFATKAHGREVHRIGVGWHWVTPVFFVDTSDMWLAGSRQRLAVSAAGLYVNMVLAGLAAIAAMFADGPTLGALWLFAAVSYLTVVLNLNPLLEYDGYHMVADWSDRPNLRREALAWSAGLLRSVGQGHGLPKNSAAHRMDMLYSLLAVAYLAALSTVLLLPARHWGQQWLESMLAPTEAQLLAWGLSLTLLAGVVLGVVADLAGRR